MPVDDDAERNGRDRVAAFNAEQAEGRRNAAEMRRQQERADFNASPLGQALAAIYAELRVIRDRLPAP